MATIIQEKSKMQNLNAMNYLVKKYPIPALRPGDVLEGTYLASEKSRLFIDLGGFGIGVVYGNELTADRNLFKNLKLGGKINVRVLNPENDEGYAELSLKKTDQDSFWQKAKEIMEKQTPLELKVSDANKGGLILTWGGINGFLPTSQLKNEHYPKIENGDKEKILSELKKFIGETLKVALIGIDDKEEKLIFSEKELSSDEESRQILKYKVGETVEGEVSGTANFGVFIKLDSGIEALSHISELDWNLVDDPAAIFKFGQKIKAKIIQIENGKIFLSIKALKNNPWLEIEKKYKEGGSISGTVGKIEKYGALISTQEGVVGLLPADESSFNETASGKPEIGKSYAFKIVLFEPKKQKLILELQN